MDKASINTGDEIDSYCGQCKIERVHNVVALVDGEVAKVICKMCGSKHKYKPVNPETEKSPPKATGRKGSTNKKKAAGTRRTSSAKSLENQWETAMAANDPAQNRPYSMDGSFQRGEVIEHKNFGHGLVIQVAAEGKMEVLFKEGPKRLICSAVR